MNPNGRSIFPAIAGDLPTDAAAILGLLPLDVACRLALHLDGDLRRHIRNRALRELRRARYADLKPCPAARALASALAAERAAPHDEELGRILVLDFGRALCWRAICEALDD